MTTTLGRLKLALTSVAVITIVGTLGYWWFGMTLLDAAYQTVINITTVGFRELDDFSTGEKWFTMFVIVFGVAAVLYTFTLAMQVVIEGQLREFVGRQRMDRQISKMSGHTIVCGWGRVGRAVTQDLARAGHEVVVVEIDPGRVQGLPYPTVVGDATLDETLRDAGIGAARSLIAALEGDAENLFVTLSGKSLRPDLFVVARARQEESVAKLAYAGADRVVNPQELGAARMASFVARPHVAEFIDVVMHESSIEFRMQEITVRGGSELAGASLRKANLRDRTGALVLAVRSPDGQFLTNPTGDTVLNADDVIIAVGTDVDIATLEELVT